MTDRSPSPRVLFVNRMAAMLRGGGETFDLEMARHLARRGCEVLFLTGIPLASGARVVLAEGAPPAGPRFVRLRTPYFGDLRWDAVPGGWRLRQLDFLLFERAAVRWADRHRAAFDVLQVCELPRVAAGWRARGRGAPLVLRLTSPLYYDPVGGLACADALVASGTSVAQLRGQGRAVEDIPNGVDTDLFRPHAGSFRQRAGIGPDELVVLNVARFVGVKNHPLLLRAFARLHAQLPGARLVLVGSGPGLGAAQDACRRAGIAGRVIFTGEQPFAAVAEIYAAADVKVIASDYESFSFTALEAMASGLPLAVTDTEWVPHLIGGAAGGRVFPRGDAEAAAAALLELARDPAARARMGRRNRETVLARYTWDASAARLLELYRRLRAR